MKTATNFHPFNAVLDQLYVLSENHIFFQENIR